MGNALALYSLGKVSQNINITINGGTFNGKDASILIKDMTKESYVNDSYKAITNKPIIKIKGGTYNTSVKDYIQDNYIEEQNDTGYTVKENIKLSTTDKNGNTTATFESEFPMPNDYKLSIEEKKLDNKTLTSITLSTKRKLEELQNNSKIKNTTLITIYDISVIQNNQTVKIEGENNYKISLKINNDLTETYKHYKFVYLDDNNEIKEVLDANLKDGFITFNTTHLSTYAIVGYNTQEENNNSLINTEKNPKTIDNTIKYIFLETISLIGLVYIGLYIKRKINKSN